MKAEDREALIALVEDINHSICEDTANPNFLTALNFGSTGDLAYLGMSFEDVWDEDSAEMCDVFEHLTYVYAGRISEASAALRCIHSMKREGQYKQFQKLDDEGE